MKSPIGYAIAALAIAAVTACAGSNAPTQSAATAPPAMGQAAAAVAPITPVIRELPVSDTTFKCIRDMKPVRGFFVTNILGDSYVPATLAAATKADGVVYPPGSLVQLVPGEAMVKHGAGYNAATNDWEFFELDVAPTGAKIKVRGTTQAVNRFGGNCLSCHIKADKARDMICEQGHGCDPIPLTAVMMKAIQNTDPRCAKVDLPPEQIAALQQLAAFTAPRPPAAQQ
jgi:hypothetical protein